ncbi:hypothetical protein DSO57_1031521 [Entomophthora muscae]|uniref:Uncharacterized protein n=1 Tax=Entomophthora muscae TaxID=34485 RepID=A0ACC2RF97_9FUNG|nr:hypothetical protein DSO57_1031521 [Entomophthora muscae]
MASYSENAKSRSDINIEDLPDDIGGLNYDDHVDDEEQIMEDIEKQLNEALYNTTNYYAIFNLPRTCSAEEIKEAYKRLCRTFHPDKHTDPQKRQLAQERFQKIGTAYEVLSDPQKRLIYDAYGEKALTMPWTVGPLLKTPEQLRDEYERLARQKREEQIENLIQTKTALQMHVDGRALFLGPEYGTLAQRMANVNLARLAMKHSYQTQLTNNLQVTVNSTLIAQNGRGGGNLGPTFRHTVSPQLVLEYGCTLLNTFVGSFKAFYQPTSDSFVNVKSTAASLWKPPTTSIVMGRSIAKNMTGFMSYNTGDWRLGPWGSGMKLRSNSALSVGVASNSEEREFQTELQVGILDTHISGQYKRKMTSRTHLVVSGSVGNQSGIAADIGAEHRVIAKTKLGASVSLGLPAGIGLRFSISRLGQSLAIPVVVSPELRPLTLLAAVAVPASLWLLTNEFIISPWRTKRLNSKLREFKELNSEYLEGRKNEALEACLLLQDAVARKVEQEKSKNGKPIELLL